MMFPLPPAVQDAPPVPEQLHVMPMRFGENAVVTVAPVTADGPEFDALTIYRTEALAS